MNTSVKVIVIGTGKRFEQKIDGFEEAVISCKCLSLDKNTR